MSSTVEQIKDRLSILDVVSSYIKVERAGKNFKAKCPFHSEKTPSFFLSPERNSYYCFGCGAKGDIFSFVEEFEGLDFLGALRVLADRAGVTIERLDPAESGKRRTERERLYALLETTTGFFEAHLAEHTDAREYLKNRGLIEATIEHFRVGWAPGPPEGGWRALHAHLLQKGFTEAEMQTAGVVKRSADEGKGERLYDVFRNRIIFPVMDPAGRPIAFSGRIFPLDAEGEGSPKYLNSPETPLFKKSEILFGFDKAKFSMRKNDFAMLVEGAMDLLMVHQAGFGNAVAILGTAFTTEHARRIKNLTHRLVIALDPDVAGIRSAGRSARLALRAGFDVKVAALPTGKDPADAVKEDPGIFKTAVRGARHIVEFMLEHVRTGAADERKFKLAVRTDVLPFVADIENKIDQEHFVSVIADAISVSPDAVREELAKVPAVPDGEDGPAGETEDLSVAEPLSRRGVIARRLTGLVLWQEGVPAEERLIKTEDVRQRFATIAGAPFPDRSVPDDDVALFEAEVTWSGSEHVAEAAEEMLSYLEEETLRERLAILMRDLKVAEREKDVARAQEILKECQIVSERMQRVRVRVAV